VALLDGDRLAVGGYHEVTFWSPNGTLLRRRRGLPERIHRIVKHPDGHRLFFCGGTPGKEGVAGWLDLTNDTPATIFIRRPDDTLSLAISPDGHLVAVAGTEPDIVLLDGVTGERQRTLRGHADWVLGLAFNPAGRLLASASRDRTARVFDVATGTVISAFRDHHEAVTAITFLDDDRLASGGRDGRVRTWTALDAKAGKSSPSHEGEVTGLLAVNGRLFSAWTRGGVLEHRVDNLEVTREYPAKDERVLGLASGGNRTELSAVTHGGRVHLWDMATARSLGEFLAMPGH
jgi:WD40 repeat protein